MTKGNIATQMRKGIVEYCILRLLHKSPKSPTELANHLSRAGLELSESSVYTILTRLVKEKRAEFRWETSPSGRPVRYFTLTAEGEQTLGKAQAEWNTLFAAISSIPPPK